MKWEKGGSFQKHVRFCFSSIFAICKGKISSLAWFWFYQNTTVGQLSAVPIGMSILLAWKCQASSDPRELKEKSYQSHSVNDFVLSKLDKITDSGLLLSFSPTLYRTHFIPFPELHLKTNIQVILFWNPLSFAHSTYPWKFFYPVRKELRLPLFCVFNSLQQVHISTSYSNPFIPSLCYPSQHPTLLENHGLATTYK